MTNDQLKHITDKPGYGVVSSFKSSFLKEKLLTQVSGKGKVPILERSDRPKSVCPQDFALPHPERCLVSVLVKRQRLTDTGNDCWKYHLDALRYLGILEADDDATISLEERPHVKVASKEEEVVEITLTFEGIDLQDVIDYYKDGPKNQNEKSNMGSA